jgi:hypothetical protein
MPPRLSCRRNRCARSGLGPGRDAACLARQYRRCSRSRRKPVDVIKPSELSHVLKAVGRKDIDDRERQRGNERVFPNNTHAAALRAAPRTKRLPFGAAARQFTSRAAVQASRTVRGPHAPYRWARGPVFVGTASSAASCPAALRSAGRRDQSCRPPARTRRIEEEPFAVTFPVSDNR